MACVLYMAYVKMLARIMYKTTLSPHTQICGSMDNIYILSHIMDASTRARRLGHAWLSKATLHVPTELLSHPVVSVAQKCTNLCELIKVSTSSCISEFLSHSSFIYFFGWGAQWFTQARSHNRWYTDESDFLFNFWEYYLCCVVYCIQMLLQVPVIGYIMTTCIWYRMYQSTFTRNLHRRNNDGEISNYLWLIPYSREYKLMGLAKHGLILAWVR